MSPRDHKPRLDGAQLAALILETAGNGVFWVLLIQALEALWYRSKALHESFFKPMTLTAAVLFCTITIHWLMDVLSAFEAFLLPYGVDIAIKGAKPLPAEMVYLTLSDAKMVLGSAAYVASTLIGDGFMIYRLYIVWGRNKWVPILPSLLLVALAVTGSVVTYLFSQSTRPIFATAGAWITSCFVLTFLCNLYSTSLIAIKIFISNRQFGRATNAGMGLTKLVEILVESAALYSVCVVTAMALYIAKSNVQFVLVAITNPIIGIIFCMIVIRVHRAGASSIGTNSRPGAAGSSHALRPVAIKITTQRDLDTDAPYPKAAEYNAAYMQHGPTPTDTTRASDV